MGIGKIIYFGQKKGKGLENRAAIQFSYRRFALYDLQLSPIISY